MPKRILIADDHLAVREGLRSLIDPDPDFKVVGEAADGNEAARKALELRPDVIMLDNSMPGMTGLEVARMLRDNLPQTKIVFLTLDPGIRDLALATGAAAHISKDQPPQEIMRVVRAAAGLAGPKATSGQPTSAQAKLAELLISEKALTSRQIQDLDRSREGKQTLSNAILRSSLVAPDALASALARRRGRASGSRTETVVFFIGAILRFARQGLPCERHEAQVQGHSIHASQSLGVFAAIAQSYS